MSSLNSKCRAKFDEWLNSITDEELEYFVFVPTSEEISFGSEDFKLVNSGPSTGEPVDCHMVEARVSSQTKDKQLRKLLAFSGSLGRDPSRLAFVLFPMSMAKYECDGRYVRQALKESPVEGESILNKIHVQWSPAVRFEDGHGYIKEGAMPFIYHKIPIAGFNVDGSKIKKKANGKK